MGRPPGPPRTPREGKCIICETKIIEKNQRLRKTCSDSCYKKSRQTARFLDEEVRKFNQTAGRERKQYLKTHYETPIYNINRV